MDMPLTFGLGLSKYVNVYKNIFTLQNWFLPGHQKEINGEPKTTKDSWQTRQVPMLSSSAIFRYVFTTLFLSLCSLASAASIPQSYQHTNLLRTIDLTKPYIRDSTALILENISNSTQNEYFWGIPIELVPTLSYLEVREKKPGSTHLFPVEPASQDHPYMSLAPFSRLTV